jgi:hypothetical protein
MQFQTKIRTVVYDLVCTTKESQYEKHDQQPAYLIRFEGIKRVETFQTS